MTGDHNFHLMKYTQKKDIAEFLEHIFTTILTFQSPSQQQQLQQQELYQPLTLQQYIYQTIRHK